MNQYEKFIKNIYYFNSLSSQNIKMILEVCSFQVFEAGKVIFEEGTPGDAFYIIVKGTVEIWKNYEKKDQNLVSIQGPGSFFGEMAIIDSQPRSATVKSIEEVHTLAISRQDFLKILEENSSISLALLRAMSSVLRSSTEKLVTNLNVKSKLLLYETEVRKLSESALRESEEKFKILADNVSDILWIIDYKKNIFTYISPAIEKILGYNPSDLLNACWHNIMTPETVKHSREFFGSIESAIQHNIKDFTHTLEMEAVHRDGTTIWIETSFHFLIDPDSDHISSTLGVSRDITRRKQVEAKLAETRALFLSALDQTSAGVILTDETGSSIQLINNEAEKVFGVKKEDIINSPLKDLGHGRMMLPDGTPYSYKGLPINIAVKHGRIINEEVIITLPDKQNRWFLFNIAPIRNDHGKIIAGMAVFPDITTNKEIENKTREYGFKFQQARKMESIATLAGGIAHEFNNALFEITGNIELLQMFLDNRDALEKYAEKIKNSAFRMATLTKKLTAYSRGGKYQPVHTYLCDIVKKALPDTNIANLNNIEIIIEEMSDTFKIEADLTQLKMAISSIMANAIESIEDKGRITLKTYTLDADEKFASRHKGFLPGRYSSLTIKDTGRGMPVQTVSKIFEPFFTTNFLGRGLGMAAVYGIVKNHNGWIGVESTPDIGTTVNVYIPVFENNQIEDKEKHHLTHLSESRVLIVEDKSAVLSLNREMFEYLGYSTVGVRNGGEAIDLISKTPATFDLAILDFDLPDMKCELLIESLKKIKPDLNVLISTGYPAEDVARILKIDQSRIIIKPYSLSTLSLKLRENLGDSLSKH